MTDNRISDGYKKNNLKALILFSYELAPNLTFYDIQKILEFLNKRIKPKTVDPNEKWVITWNDYLGRFKFFFRWLYNYRYEGFGENFQLTCWKTRSEAMRREISSLRRLRHDIAQPLSYSSWRRHQTPVSLRPLGARSSHWYMPQRPSSPRA